MQKGRSFYCAFALRSLASLHLFLGLVLSSAALVADKSGSYCAAGTGTGWSGNVGNDDADPSNAAIVSFLQTFGDLSQAHRWTSGGVRGLSADRRGKSLIDQSMFQEQHQAELVAALAAHPGARYADAEALAAGPAHERAAAYVPVIPEISLDEDASSFLAEEQQLRRVVDELEATTVQAFPTAAASELVVPPVMTRGLGVDLAQAKVESIDSRLHLRAAMASIADNSTENSTENSTSNTSSTVEAPDMWELLLTGLGPLSGIALIFSAALSCVLAPLGAALAWVAGGMTKAFSTIGNAISSAFAAVATKIATTVGGSGAVNLPSFDVGIQASSLLICWILVGAVTGMITWTRRGGFIGALLGLIAGCVNLIGNFDRSWIEIGVYLLFTSLIAAFYRTFLVYQYPPLRRPPEDVQGRWSFGLFDGLLCDPDCRICFTSFVFTAVRWADTTTAEGIQVRKTQYTFWVYCLGFTFLASTAVPSYGVSAILLLMWGVWARQKMRKAYDLPHGDIGTITSDCCVWTWCAPCATMQEAMQAEFVDVPTPSFPRPSQSFQSPSSLRS